MQRKRHDSELIGRILDGDRESFDYFFSFYFPKIYNFISLHVSDRRVAERLTDTVMSEAVHAFERYSEAISLDCWMLQITREVLEFEEAVRANDLAEAI